MWPHSLEMELSKYLSALFFFMFYFELRSLAQMFWRLCVCVFLQWNYQQLHLHADGVWKHRSEHLVAKLQDCESPGQEVLLEKHAGGCAYHPQTRYFILFCLVLFSLVKSDSCFLFHFGVISFGLVRHSNHTWVQTKTIMTRPLTGGDRGLVLKELWSGSFVGGMWSNLGPTHDSCGWMFVAVWDTTNYRIS